MSTKSPPDCPKCGKPLTHLTASVSETRTFKFGTFSSGKQYGRMSSREDNFSVKCPECGADITEESESFFEWED